MEPLTVQVRGVLCYVYESITSLPVHSVCFHFPASPANSAFPTIFESSDLSFAKSRLKENFELSSILDRGFGGEGTL